MDFLPQALVDRARTPTGQKLIKYTAVSAISVVIAEIMLAFAYFIVRWSGTISNIFAVGVSSIPSYYLNRAWAWGKRGRSHLVKEVLPFWGLAFLGLGISTIAVHVVEPHAKHLTGSRGIQTLIVVGTNLAAFGVLWVGKFIIFNELMFKHHPEVLDDEPALDGRAGIPT